MISNSELATLLSDAFNQHGYFSTRTAVMQNTGISLTTFSRRFGTWSNACEAAGLCLLYGRHNTRPCEFCTKEFTRLATAGIRYCSVACANNARRKKPPSLRTHTRTRAEYLADVKLTPTKILEADFESLKWGRKRMRVILDQKNACNRCTLTHWLGAPLVLELEHKDGNNDNNNRNNLEALCPNCHSLTPTWRGRNKKKHPANLDMAVLALALSTGTSLSQALKEQGRCGKGKAHTQAKKALLELT